MSLLSLFCFYHLERHPYLTLVYIAWVNVEGEGDENINMGIYKVQGDPDKKNEIFVKYCSLYLHDTDCKTVRLNATENPPF